MYTRIVMHMCMFVIHAVCQGDAYPLRIRNTGVARSPWLDIPKLWAIWVGGGRDALLRKGRLERLPQGRGCLLMALLRYLLGFIITSIRHLRR